MAEPMHGQVLQIPRGGTRRQAAGARLQAPFGSVWQRILPATARGGHPSLPGGSPGQAKGRVGLEVRPTHAGLSALGLVRILLSR